jgi:hypothetical protein
LLLHPCQFPIERLMRQTQLDRPILLGLRYAKLAARSEGPDVMDDPFARRIEGEAFCPNARQPKFAGEIPIPVVAEAGNRRPRCRSRRMGPRPCSPQYSNHPASCRFFSSVKGE